MGEVASTGQVSTTLTLHKGGKRNEVNIRDFLPDNTVLDEPFYFNHSLEAAFLDTFCTRNRSRLLGPPLCSSLERVYYLEFDES